MINVDFEFGDGVLKDSFTEFGLIYVSSDTIFSAPQSEFEVTEYAEKEGCNIDPRTVSKSFDYKVKFLIETKNQDLSNANAVIAAFNKQLYTEQDGVRFFKEITFHNYYKRVKIVGTPTPMADAKDFYRLDKTNQKLDCVQVELNIKVTTPSKCDFSYNKK